MLDAASLYSTDPARAHLLALRAIATQPLNVLSAISDDPAGDWRDRNTPVIRSLAAVELRDCGLRPSTALE